MFNFIRQLKLLTTNHADLVKFATFFAFAKKRIFTNPVFVALANSHQSDVNYDKR